ncbi:hypothetical protein [Streptomyces sp. NRRL F-2580]|uniref:hypothetical protein n=1 Tax=Streptomyces sp. NRRL F-2580 TaxID=1463841 RepID=UPI00099C0FBF|nr:hypothetical protein [Streptomyces sp. NRRL F-2580]
MDPAPLAGGARPIVDHNGRCLTATTSGEPLRLKTCAASNTAQWYLDETTVTAGPTQGGDT